MPRICMHTDSRFNQNESLKASSRVKPVKSISLICCLLTTPYPFHLLCISSDLPRRWCQSGSDCTDQQTAWCTRRSVSGSSSGSGGAGCHGRSGCCARAAEGEAGIRWASWKEDGSAHRGPPVAPAEDAAAEPTSYEHPGAHEHPHQQSR